MASQAIKNWYRDNLIPKYNDALTWQQCLDAINDLDATEQANIITAFKAKNTTEVGKIWGIQLKQNLVALATAEADTALADDQLDLTEIERIV